MTRLSLTDLINQIVPISRFNRGEAKSVFEEVQKDGPKVVMRNNTPLCVLISPEDYTELIENYNEKKDN